MFAWRTCRAVKSNAIVIAADGATVGVGMGQVNRVDAARLAVERGGDRVRGAVAASDAFFPFPDGLETLTAAGVKAIVHPGGSMRDDVVTEAAREGGHHAVPDRSAALRALTLVPRRTWITPTRKRDERGSSPHSAGRQVDSSRSVET